MKVNDYLQFKAVLLFNTCRSEINYYDNIVWFQKRDERFSYSIMYITRVSFLKLSRSRLCVNDMLKMYFPMLELNLK